MRYKPFRVTLVAEKLVRVTFELDAASPNHAMKLARDLFKEKSFDAEGCVGTEDHGWKLLTKRGNPTVEEMPTPSPSDDE